MMTEDEGRGSASGSPAEKDADASTAETTESGNDDSINVVVRVRPLNKNELEKKDPSTVQFPGEGVLCVSRVVPFSQQAI
ncbi:hypothetical protein EB796_021835 [Bugula neritina]|uniref:Kinesin motor domain-containing protein n=1 Tax=Bugula neritina TaxID=10212 RepID=A0A7J7J2F2_BUGNE|nr:hypothetical protein EB796_021835 [Bugula neritina]